MVRLAMVLLALIAFGAPAAKAAQLVVVEAQGTTLQPGQVIDASQPLQLPAGAKLALIGEDGKVSRIEGPFSGPPSQVAGAGTGDPSTVQSLSRLFAGAQPNATSWGTFRGYDSPATFRGDEAGRGTGAAQGLWAVNVRRSESACVPADSRPVLWRPEASEALSVVLLHLSTGREAAVDFAAGAHDAAWPTGVPLLDGGEYAIRDGNLWERRLSVRIIPAESGSDVRRAAWMADAGCFRQARALLAQAL